MEFIDRLNLGMKLCILKRFMFAGWIYGLSILVGLQITNTLHICVLYNCGGIFFILSFFVLYNLPFGLVRLRTFRLSAWVS